MTFLPVTTELKGPKAVLCGFDNVIFLLPTSVLFCLGKMLHRHSPKFLIFALVCATRSSRQQQQQQFTAMPSTRSDLLHKSFPAGSKFF